MAEPLARLRVDLDFMPSPVPERPGLLIRDPHQYSDATLIIPPPLVACLEHFNGEATELDLRAELVRISGSLDVSELEEDLVSTLRNAGFLEDDHFRALRESCHRRFAEASVREAAHAGGAYPDEAGLLRDTIDGYFAGVPESPAGQPVGVAAPHVSPEGGAACFGAAYRALPAEAGTRTFVILGTSHYGEPDKFGLTRKPFRTPYGEARTETSMVDLLAAAAPDAVVLEDYCHSTEHSIEFQTVFLQHVFGPEISIVPILVGTFGRCLYNGGKPESDDGVHAFLEALGELAARDKDRLFWVLGVDMAHMGRRYGDRFSAVARQGVMREVAERDRKRIDRIEAADADGFWELIRENHDDLKWCGSAPFYTFLKAVPGVRARLLHYEQWNIDPDSVVTFGALAFG